jgi:hypothetical protein
LKYKGGNFCQIFNDAIKKLNVTNCKVPYSARWLYVHLNYLEHRFTGKNEDYFFRSIKDLQKDTQIGRKQIINGIKILKNIGLIQTWQMHWMHEETKKKSKKHITAFRILNI